MTQSELWERIKAEFREWSLPQYLIDGFVSLLIPYVIYLVTAIAWYQLVVLKDDPEVGRKWDQQLAKMAPPTRSRRP